MCLRILDPNVISSSVLEPSSSGFPVSTANDVGWEVVLGSSDNKDEFLGVNFEGY